MNKKILINILKIICVVIFLYLFLVSIGLMEVAFKGFGKGFSENLLKSTSNPFLGLFIGILATSLVQSSSTTTSMVVGFVASQALSIENAIPMIMGANIGTTVTNTMVSFGHMGRKEEFKRAIACATVHDFFNIICVLVFFPLELATGFLQKLATLLTNTFINFGGIKFAASPIKKITKPLIHLIEKTVIQLFSLPEKLGYSLILAISFIILFIALYYIVKLMKSLIIEKTEAILDNILSKHSIIGIIAGMIFTIFVQSSSITTSLLVPMVGAGIISVELAFPLTLGANIGTTTTAILASFATCNPAAITIAFVHLIFNILGILLIYPFKIFRSIPIMFAKNLGELVFKNRMYALVYVGIVFFLLPILLIFVSKLLLK